MTVDGYDWSLTLFGWYLCACHVGQHMHTDIPIHTGKGTMKMCECVCVCTCIWQSESVTWSSALHNLVGLRLSDLRRLARPWVLGPMYPLPIHDDPLTISQHQALCCCTTAALCVPEICKQSNPREYKTLKTSHICEDYGKFGTPQKHKEDTSSHDSCQTFSNISKCWTLFTLIVNIGLCDVTRAHTLWHQQLVDKTICGTKWEIKSVWIL